MIILRRETTNDYKIVEQVIEAAFKNAEHTDHSEHLLVPRLRDSSAFIPELSIVAVLNDQVVGHIIFTRIYIVDGDKRYPSLALAPVSVLPEFQGQGIGGKLINEGHHIAKNLGEESSILLGHADYYPRFGYRLCKDYGIRLPFEAPDENCMALELEDNTLTGVTGVVEYSEAFFAA